MAKKKRIGLKVGLPVIAIIAILAVIGIWQGWFSAVGGEVTAQGFTPVYCNDYEFTCCAWKEGSLQSTILDIDDRLFCDLENEKCTLKSISGMNDQNKLYKGSINCRQEKSWFGFGYSYWKCDNEVKIPVAPQDFGKGVMIFHRDSNSRPTVSWTKTTARLLFTGKSGSSSGVPIQGADRCSYTSQKNVFTTRGQDTGKKQIQELGDGECVLSYQQGDRHICGNLEEACDSDSDCGGHTYGNFECIGRTLQEYGCRQFGDDFDLVKVGSNWFVPDAKSVKNLLTGETFDYTSSRCEIKSAKQVQCCGDADCGSSYRCDVNPSSSTAWTCQKPEDVKCRQDSDCGVSLVCDATLKQIKKPICENYQCSFDKVKTVECCTDAQCSTDEFCNNNKKCEQRGDALSQCPFECCPAFESDDARNYVDKPCPGGQFCHQDHECRAEQPVSTNGGGTGGACTPTLAIGNLVIIPSFEQKDANFFQKFVFGKTDVSCVSGFGWFAFILGLIVLLVLPFFIDKVMVGWGNKNKAVNLSIGFVISFLAYILILNYFWWGVAGAVLVGIVLLIFRRVTR